MNCKFSQSILTLHIHNLCVNLTKLYSREQYFFFTFHPHLKQNFLIEYAKIMAVKQSLIPFYHILSLHSYEYIKYVYMHAVSTKNFFIIDKINIGEINFPFCAYFRVVNCLFFFHENKLSNKCAVKNNY